jgi:hypothetical protein
MTSSGEAALSDQNLLKFFNKTVEPRYMDAVPGFPLFAGESGRSTVSSIASYPLGYQGV